ncbi:MULTISPECIES: hypothetical protein [unclassified Anabaena]|uniref:hypothetical protein n=1 Tax=unclassified Anabaena TaxID=2619674 RepID=UPI0006AC8E91|nr:MULTISPECIES: hypothetical protein [unclassified Anabaena]ALB42412.1 hypothetical protein AA650_19845 [Anabaena sp. WA102]OBQ23251.1 MAG: hypothetical protein AN486_00155 [Anabaena sp. AL93]
MSKLYLFSIVIVFLITYSLDALAAGGGDPTADQVVTTGTNTTSAPNTGTASDLNTNSINQGFLPYPGFSSSSYSGYSSTFTTQCGFSISTAYGNNGNPLSNNGWQIVSTFNTNPCVNQSNVEKFRQENENKRETIRANAQIINTCINGRVQAVQKGINPDIVCKFEYFQIPKNP